MTFVGIVEYEDGYIEEVITGEDENAVEIKTWEHFNQERERMLDNKPIGFQVYERVYEGHRF